MTAASTVEDVSAETVQFIVASTGVDDAGSAVGTIIYAKVAKSPILNSSKTGVGNVLDTSFAWGTGDVLTDQVTFPNQVWEELNSDWSKTRAVKMAEFAATYLTVDGQYAIDHRTGLIIGRKDDTGATDTADYSCYTVSASSSGSSGEPDETAFVAGTTVVQPMAGVASDGVTPTDVAVGEIGGLAMTTDRALWSYLAYLNAGEDQTNNVQRVRFPGSYSYISTATTTTVKSGFGYLNSITISEVVASTIIVYDNTAGSGTIIASFPASAPAMTYFIEASFATGLTIVTAGASKLSVSYQ